MCFPENSPIRKPSWKHTNQQVCISRGLHDFQFDLSMWHEFWVHIERSCCKTMWQIRKFTLNWNKQDKFLSGDLSVISYLTCALTGQLFVFKTCKLDNKTRKYVPHKISIEHLLSNWQIYLFIILNSLDKFPFNLRNI